MEGQGIEKAYPYPAEARFKFGDGRIGEARYAADITVGIAGYKGSFTAFVLDAEIPALLCKGALEALYAKLDFVKGTLVSAARY